MKPKLTDAQKVARIVARHEDWSFYERYSGRCMYGRTCPGIILQSCDVQKAVNAVKRAITGKVTHCTDNMGLDMIVYFPGLSSDPVDELLNDEEAHIHRLGIMEGASQAGWNLSQARGTRLEAISDSEGRTGPK